MHPDSKKYTGIILSTGEIYECNRLVFGWSNAPSHYQHEISQALMDFPFCHVYLDDIIVASSSPEEHCEHLRQLFTRLEALKVTVSLHKCKFGFSELNYLGFILNRDGILVDPSKKDEIEKFPEPQKLRFSKVFCNKLKHKIHKIIIRFLLS
eukprot:Nk52_evm1s1697 gene=Nk52_evmTU1s1697